MALTPVGRFTALKVTVCGDPKLVAVEIEYAIEPETLTV
jgi:hypothetical protein